MGVVIATAEGSPGCGNAEGRAQAPRCRPIFSLCRMQSSDECCSCNTQNSDA